MKVKLVVLISIMLTVTSIFITKPCIVNAENINMELVQKTQLSFAAFSDTHIGVRYQYPIYSEADCLDLIAKDLLENTNKLDFAVHLGDIVNHNTAHVNGAGLPWYVNQYKNNLKAFLVSNINLPFYCVLGNHDVCDYEMNGGDPHNLTKSLIDELSMNNPMYAMMRDGILFLIVPELAYVTWTHPVEYEWVEYMTKQYPEATTIILSHQAIEDTTEEEHHIPYRGKQDINWWVNLFENNPQIKMWIHGHNHMLDWYVSNQSTGVTKPVEDFGHEIAFSAPYSQVDWRSQHEEDRTVIYNITSSSISTEAWENNGFGGKWATGYSNSWSVQTSYDPNAENWYSFPMFLQDNETQLTDMKLLSPDIILQLVGTKPMELFYDSKMESPSGWADEIILGFDDDKTGNAEWDDPGMIVHGPTTISFPNKSPLNEKHEQEDGRSGQPYHSFPMGTICVAVPGQAYNFTITGRSDSGSGRINMNVSCCDWGTKSQYSILPNSQAEVISYTFGSEFETIHGIYTVPDNENAWFLQGTLEFLNSTDYNVSLFSVKREKTSETTDNFHLCLSGNWFNYTGILEEDEMINFTVSPEKLSDSNGIMNFTAFVDGNRYGMVNLIYHEPILLSRNARFRVNSYNDDVFNLSLTKTISRNSPAKMVIWDSAIFKKFPLATELLSRFLFTGFTGRIFDSIFKNANVDFKMFPFSTDTRYSNINIIADDNSGKKHISDNGNIWLTCNCPKNDERYVQIILPIE